jgi:hypothetical protein
MASIPPLETQHFLAGKKDYRTRRLFAKTSFGDFIAGSTFSAFIGCLIRYTDKIPPQPIITILSEVAGIIPDVRRRSIP